MTLTGKYLKEGLNREEEDFSGILAEPEQRREIFPIFLNNFLAALAAHPAEIESRQGKHAAKISAYLWL